MLDTALSGIARFPGGHRDRYVAGEREIPLISGLRDGQVGLPWQQGVELDEVGPRLGDGGDAWRPSSAVPTARATGQTGVGPSTITPATMRGPTRSPDAIAARIASMALIGKPPPISSLALIGNAPPMSRMPVTPLAMNSGSW